MGERFATVVKSAGGRNYSQGTQRSIGFSKYKKARSEMKKK